LKEFKVIYSDEKVSIVAEIVVAAAGCIKHLPREYLLDRKNQFGM